jgi:hypothetical protein
LAPLSKRREILEKSSVNEILQDSLLRSPLSDKVCKAPTAERKNSAVPRTCEALRSKFPIWPTRTEKGEAHQLVWPLFLKGVKYLRSLLSMKFFRTPYFVLLFLIRFLVYLYRRFRRRSIRHLSLLGSMCN